MSQFREDTGEQSEGVCRRFLPEIIVLGRVVAAGTRRVADDTHAQERHTAQVTDLCDGARLHVHSQRIGEVVQDTLDSFDGVNELVA